MVEIEKARYKTKKWSDYKEIKWLRPKLHRDTHDVRTLNENQQYKGYNSEAEEKELNRREYIKLILNFFQKQDQFSSTINEEGIIGKQGQADLREVKGI